MSDFWEVRIQDIAEVLVSNVDKKKYAGQKAVVLCNYMDVYSNDYISSNLNFMESTASEAEINKFSLKKGDVIITKDSESPFDIGIPSVVIEDIDNLVCGYHLAIIRPNLDKVDPLFLAKQLSSEKSTRYFARVAAGSTRFGLSVGSIHALPVQITSLEAQKRIGGIGLTIDNQIEATQALIDKYIAIKQGMMADLFSRGIDPETKALRPTFKEAPELYHKTLLGMLPKGWDAYDIEDISDVIDPNPSHRNPIYRADGFAFISTVEFIEGDSVETNTSRRVAESVVLEQERRCVFNENSIVFSRKGTIGETRFVPTSCRFALLDSLCVLNPKNVDVKYFYHSLRSPSLKTQINQMVMGQALPQVSIGRVRELLIPMPDDAMEQRLIGQRIGGIAELLNSELLHLRKLQVQKAGLMQDLLTGKVPVPV